MSDKKYKLCKITNGIYKNSIGKILLTEGNKAIVTLINTPKLFKEGITLLEVKNLKILN